MSFSRGMPGMVECTAIISAEPSSCTGRSTQGNTSSNISSGRRLRIRRLSEWSGVGSRSAPPEKRLRQPTVGAAPHNAMLRTERLDVAR